MKTRKDYYSLVEALSALEKVLAERFNKSWVYLTDECIDRENVLESGEVTDGSDEFWNGMYNSAASAAGFRAEEMGLSVNDELGYVIY